MSTHLPYSASATDRWLACPASVNAARDLPPQLTEEAYTTEGTDAHAAAESLLRGQPMPLAGMSEEVIEAAMDYVNHVVGIRHTRGVEWEAIEELVAHADFPDFGGSPDYACLYQEAGKWVLHIVDFKAGVGLAVDVDDNSQLLSYSAVLESLLPVTISLFRMTVIQPRSYNSEATKTTEVFRENIDDHMRKVEAAFEQTHFHAGPHCRFCPVASRCETLINHIETIPLIEGVVPTEETMDKWLLLHSLATTIRNVLDQVQLQLIDLAKNGHELPGYKVVESRSHRHWSVPEKEIISALRKLGIKKADVFSEPKLLSPAQVEKLGDKKIIKSAITPLVSQTTTSLRVVSNDASGTPVTFGDEFDEF